MAGPGLLRFRGMPPGPKYGNVTGGGNLVTGRTGSVAARFYLRNGPEFSRQLASLAQRVSDEKMAQAVLAGGEALAVEWKRIVPVDEGHYRESITAVASPGRQGATGLVFPADVPGVPDNEQPRRYAARLEFGSLAQTKKQLQRGIFPKGRARRMQPSLRPAFDNVHTRMVDAIADELRALLP